MRQVAVKNIRLVGNAKPEAADQTEQPAAQAEKPAGLYTKELAAQAFQKGGCRAFHVIPGVPGAAGTIGPDLIEIGQGAKARLESGEYTGMAKVKRPR